MNADTLQRFGLESDADIARRFSVSKTTIRHKRIALGIPPYKRVTNLTEDGLKKCCICRVEKDPSEFSPSKRHLDGLDPRCHLCLGIASREYQIRNPEKYRAHIAVNLAKRRGILVPPETCENCGKSAKLDGHHWHGYEPNHILDVQWLCRSCHRAADHLLRERGDSVN